MAFNSHHWGISCFVSRGLNMYTRLLLLCKMDFKEEKKKKRNFCDYLHGFYFTPATLIIIFKKVHWTGFNSRCKYNIYCYPSNSASSLLVQTPIFITPPPNLGRVTVFQQTLVSLPPKKLLSNIKSVTDPCPGPQFHFYKMEKELKLVFQDANTPLLKTSPSQGHLKMDTAYRRDTWDWAGRRSGTVI